VRRPPTVRLARLLAASLIVELAVDAAAGVAADLTAPVLGDMAYVIAGIVIVATLPLLIANAARVIRMELSEPENEPS
jgi:hypothetical protein